MLPYYLGTTKITPAPVDAVSTSEVLTCVRCSAGALSVNNTQRAAVCAKGHIQCTECDASMRHQCRRCGIATTVLWRRESTSNATDPKSLSPEELTQLELNTALQLFKTSFIKNSSKRKKRPRLVESTSRIIEILNPNLILPYMQCGRPNQIEVEEHFFRTSEKSQHTFTWHKAALEFVMDRIVNLQLFHNMQHNDNINDNNNNNENALNIAQTLNNPELQELRKQSIMVSETKSNFTFDKKQSQHRTENRFLKKQKSQMMSNDGDLNGSTSVHINNPEETFSEVALISVKPTTWLTEISCPHCELFLRLSDFSKHFAVYHCLPIECMHVGDTKLICLDPHIVLNRNLYPHTLFLLKNVVRDFGGSDYSNLYPIVLITAAFRKMDVTDVNPIDGDQKYLMIWLSGIYLNVDIQVCLKLKSNRDCKQGQCLKLDKLYPITKPQRLKDIYESGETLVLSPEIHNALSKNGIENIVLEITIQQK